MLLSGLCMSFSMHLMWGGAKAILLSMQMADESGLQYDRLRALDSPALRAGNWSQLCVTCKARPCALSRRLVMRAACLPAWQRFVKTKGPSGYKSSAPIGSTVPASIGSTVPRLVPVW